MKITLEHYEMKTSIENEFDDLTIGQVFSELIKPLLLSAGFNQDSIDRCLNKDEIYE